MKGYIIILLLTLVLFSGCTNTNDNANVLNDDTSVCPSSLQVCGEGCIPSNAICCDDGSVNGYCLQPTTYCGEGTCNSCPEGQVFCGMFCKSKGEECCVDTDCSSSTSVVTQDISDETQNVVSPYDGTYIGTFYYEYQDKDYVEEKIGPWIPSSFTLELTLKTIQKDIYDIDSYYYIDVTNAISNIDGFETGSEGVDPRASYDETSMWLPANPTNDEEGYAASMYLYFPNRAVIDVPIPGDSEPKSIIVSPDGKTLSSNPAYVPDFNKYFPYSWRADTPAQYSEFSDGNAQEYLRSFKFLSWSLTKVSD